MAPGHRIPAHAARLGAALLLAVSVAASCGADEADPAVEEAGRASDVDPGPTDDQEAGDEELFPDIVAASATRADDGTWRFDVTVSSPYDTPARYADGWRILGPDDTELGVRVLTHDHQFEQPFTRSLSGVVIPDGVTTVTVEGRDQVSGWGGTTVEVALP